MEKQVHNFAPVYDKDSKYLFLGSFPSVKSRNKSFYYMHPKNRFYPLLEKVFKDEFTTENIDKKIKLLNKHHIALFDVVKSCEIHGSSDSSIKNIELNNIDEIVNNSKIKTIILNGKLAYSLFIKHFPHLLDKAYYLPSTSPANAKCSLNDLEKFLLEIINK